MAARLEARVADKLAKVMGLFASDSAGERDAAVVRATAVLRSNGLAWADLVLLAVKASATPQPLPAPQEAPHVVTARWALAFRHQLNERERKFLNSVLRLKALTPRQRAWLEVIADELRQGGAS
jgi:hypothetical protein